MKPVSSPTRLSNDSRKLNHRTRSFVSPGYPGFTSSETELFLLFICSDYVFICFVIFDTLNALLQETKKAGASYLIGISATRLSLRDPVGFPPHPREWLSIIVYHISTCKICSCLYMVITINKVIRITNQCIIGTLSEGTMPIRTSTIRSAALPSHFSGTLPFL